MLVAMGATGKKVVKENVFSTPKSNQTKPQNCICPNWLRKSCSGDERQIMEPFLDTIVMTSRNGKKSSGLRILWIPGGRKGHPKGRFDSTNKQISYSVRQKKSQVWSLGGSKAQNELLRAEPDVSLLDGPSTSGIATLACATALGSPSNAQCLVDAPPAARSNATSETLNQISPTTPNSTASTALLLSPPQSPLITTDLDHIDSDTEQPSTMPAKSHQPIPVTVTTTTTAEIMEENRFSILGKDITTNEFDIYTLPSPPKKDMGNSEENLNSSSGTTASQKSPSGSPLKETATSISTNESHHHNNGSVNNSPVKKKPHNRNHNNNQGDVNSIESITEDTSSEKIPSADLDWIDSALQDRNDREILAKPKKKKKKKLSNGKELDQLDGVPMKDLNNGDVPEEEEEKVVKCLYYTLMCCDCTIS